ncbi:MAG: hypothetical protein ABIH11_08310 [Candidatus Altiarchaeota archaeon]
MDVKAFILVLLMASSVSATSGSVNIVVSENGNAFVIMVLEGAGTVDVPLPLDVHDPVVRGCLYIQSASGIEVSMTEKDTATIAYKTTLLTSKDGEMWVVESELPVLNGSSVLLSLPSNALVRDSSPVGRIMDSNDSKNMMWDNTNRLMVAYNYPKTDSTTTTVNPQATTTTLAREEGSFVSGLVGTITLMAVFLLLMVSGIMFIMRYGGKTRLSQGMANVMKTMSGNEYKVVDVLLKKGGGMRRSNLERSSGISKSSLAVALNNLERKGVISVNREDTTHYVELTEWFKKL